MGKLIEWVNKLSCVKEFVEYGGYVHIYERVYQREKEKNGKYRTAKGSCLSDRPGRRAMRWPDPAVGTHGTRCSLRPRCTNLGCWGGIVRGAGGGGMVRGWLIGWLGGVIGWDSMLASSTMYKPSLQSDTVG